MLSLPPSVHIYVAAEPVDLRNGFDGLTGLTRRLIREDPFSGHLFVFINRRRNRAKILVWENSGFWLLYKRLEKGCFKLPRQAGAGSQHIQVDATELAIMLEGIDLRGAKRRPRWSPKD